MGEYNGRKLILVGNLSYKTILSYVSFNELLDWYISEWIRLYL